MESTKRDYLHEIQQLEDKLLQIKQLLKKHSDLIDQKDKFYNELLDKLSEIIDQQLEAMGTVSKVLVEEIIIKSIGLIKTWHNMGMPEDTAEGMWKIYFEKSPEMKLFRDWVEKLKIEDKL